MAKYKIEVTDECIACGACVAQCDNFEMDGDKAKPKKKEVNDILVLTILRNNKKTDKKITLAERK